MNMNEPINQQPVTNQSESVEPVAVVPADAPEVQESNSLIDDSSATPAVTETTPAESVPAEAAPTETAAEAAAETAAEAAPAEAEDAPAEDAVAEPDLDATLGALAVAVENVDKRVDALEEQLQGYRDETARTFLQPVFNEMIGIYTDLLQSADFASEDDADTFRGFADHLSYLFTKLDLEVIPTDEDAAFDAKFHASVQKKKSDDEALNGAIARVVRHGLRVVGADRALVPARVAVYKYQAPAAPAESELPTVEPIAESPTTAPEDPALTQREAGQN